MRFLKKDICEDGYFYGWDILWFKIGKLHFRWFTDCGEWFIYIEWHSDNMIQGHRFSSAGYIKINHEKNK